jgi:hypothetical protein
MKSILNTGLSLMASPKRPFAGRSGRRQMIGFTAACLLTACTMSVSAQADTISISYSLSGGPTGPPVVSGTTLILDGLFTGSILSGSPALNAVWNPVTYSDHSVADLTTGLLDGTFSMTFANGDILSGTVFEDVSAVLATGGTGPYTQTFTFTGGTGEFRGATGSASGGGVATSTVTTVSGSGSLTAAGIAVPEPASVALILGGLVAIVAKGRRIRQQG